MRNRASVHESREQRYLDIVFAIGLLDWPTRQYICSLVGLVNSPHFQGIIDDLHNWRVIYVEREPWAGHDRYVYALNCDPEEFRNWLLSEDYYRGVKNCPVAFPFELPF
jgi:hypothetical protein